MKTQFYYIVVLIAVSVATTILPGCSSHPMREDMTIPSLVVNKHHPYSLVVKANGGGESGLTKSKDIQDDDLKAAIEESIKQANLFKSVLPGPSGDYELTVRVINNTTNFIGSINADVEATWSLEKMGDHTVVWRKSIISRGHANFGDAFVGETRLRKAVEAAVRDNISQGIKGMAELNL